MTRIFLQLFLLYFLMVLSPFCLAIPEYAYEAIMRLDRITHEQAAELLAQPIPEHARKEINFGFADENFVRFVNAMRDITPKLRGISERKYHPTLFVVIRYSCATDGLDGLLDNIRNKDPNYLTCLRAWARFLKEGPELPFKIDFPLVDPSQPWLNPSAESLASSSEIAEYYYHLYELPKILYEDVVALKVSHRKIKSMLEDMRKHPKDKFNDELAIVESQPPEARRFARLICLNHSMSLELSDSAWSRRCYAYWHRYLEMKED